VAFPAPTLTLCRHRHGPSWASASLARRTNRRRNPPDLCRAFSALARHPEHFARSEEPCSCLSRDSPGPHRLSAVSRPPCPLPANPANRACVRVRVAICGLLVPSSRFLRASTACSTAASTGLLHPASGHEVQHVSRFRRPGCPKTSRPTVAFPALLAPLEESPSPTARAASPQPDALMTLPPDTLVTTNQSPSTPRAGRRSLKRPPPTTTRAETLDAGPRWNPHPRSSSRTTGKPADSPHFVEPPGQDRRAEPTPFQRVAAPYQACLAAPLPT